MPVGQAIRISSATDLADNVTAAVDAFVIYGQAKNLSPNTLLYYQYRLRAFRDYLDRHAVSSAPKDITPRVIREFINDEIQRRSPSTANHSVTTLRAFFGFLVDDGFLDSNVMNGVKKVRCRKPLIETFTLEQLEAILATCDKSFVGVRDQAIILVLFDTGIRASELCGLTLDDVSWTEQTMTVLGKGDRERVVSFGKATRQALALYLARRGDVETDRLLISVYADPIDRHRLRRIIRARCERVGVTGVRCSPHTFRHTFAVTYLRNGGDVFSLQRLLGHADLSMTRRYCQLTQADALDKHRAHSPGDTLRIAKPRSGRKIIA